MIVQAAIFVIAYALHVYRVHLDGVDNRAYYMKRGGQPWSTFDMHDQERIEAFVIHAMAFLIYLSLCISLFDADVLAVVFYLCGNLLSMSSGAFVGDYLFQRQVERAYGNPFPNPEEASGWLDGQAKVHRKLFYGERRRYQIRCSFAILVLGMLCYFASYNHETIRGYF
jgi:hypothetical protein